MHELNPDNTPHLEGSRLSETTERAVGGAYVEDDADKRWISLAQSCHRSSDEWFTSSVRKQAERAIAHFQSRHPAGSKYYTTYYDKRSRLFRPKTRSMVRGIEAASATAFFSTADAVKCRPLYEGNKNQQVAATIFQDLINHRLSDTDMHWFLNVVGATQDGATVGIVISRQDWQYEEYDGVIRKDTPRVELLPFENFRISPAAKWWDPVNTSPFVIELVPMYVSEIRERMQKFRADGKRIYRPMSDTLLQAGVKQQWDTVRKSRHADRVDPMDTVIEIPDFDTVWVHRNIVRQDGIDYVYDTLGAELMLSADVRPLAEVYRHNLRPYVMGFMVVETHKIYPPGPTGLVEPLQEEANDVCNLRLDNIRLALGKRYVVRRGRGVDTTSLTRNVPSSVIMASDTNADVKELTTQDVTRSSYEEQDRINNDFDELAGRFSGSSVASNRKLNETVGGMTMMREDANVIQEYQIRVFAETWVEPVMRQIVALESVYESDKELLTAIGERHGLDITGVLDHLHMSAKIRPAVDVGFNSTSPEKRIQKLGLGLQTIAQAYPAALQTADPAEIIKEVMGALGLKDGSRFFPMLRPGGDDPRIQLLQQQIQQLQQALEGKQMEIEGRIRVAEIGAEARIAAEQIRAEVAMMKDEVGANLELLLVKMKQRLEEIDRAIAVEDSDVRRRELYLQREALSHNILESDRNYRLELMRMGQEQGEAAAERGVKREAIAAKGNGGPHNLKGNDKAGVLARDRYGDIPQAGG